MQFFKYVICALAIMPLQASEIGGSLSIVYNLRLSETSKRLDTESILPKPSLATCTLISSFRKQYNGVTFNDTGGLLTLMYSPESFFLRVDAAVAHLTSDDHGIHSARTQGDDLLFSAGYSPKTSEKMRFTYSGLVGLPLHKDRSLEQIQLGYGHYGLGGQMDGSFVLAGNEHYKMHCAVRGIHFFPRSVVGELNNHERCFDYNFGNVVDLLIAFQRKKKPHGIEIGYNPEFSFSAFIHPNLDDVVTQTNYILNSFYSAYDYSFKIRNTVNIVAAAFSFGFDASPKIYGYKRAISVWGSWSVNF